MTSHNYSEVPMTQASIDQPKPFTDTVAYILEEQMLVAIDLDTTDIGMRAAQIASDLLHERHTKDAAEQSNRGLYGRERRRKVMQGSRFKY